MRNHVDLFVMQMEPSCAAEALLAHASVRYLVAVRVGCTDRKAQEVLGRAAETDITARRRLVALHRRRLQMRGAEHRDPISDRLLRRQVDIRPLVHGALHPTEDRKSTRLNS